MTIRIITMLVGGLLLPLLIGAQDFSNEEFTDEDFAKFFGIIEDGKITPEKMSKRCEEEILGFTFAGQDVVHEGGRQRVYYNETGLDGTVDGRVLRSRHFNLSLGEWTGAVLKPICPGMWVITVDYTVASKKRADPVRLSLYVREAGAERPGRSVISTVAERGASGQLTIALPLHAADEVTTWTEVPGSEQTRTLERITFTGYKIAHLEKWIEEFDVDEFNTELEAAR